MQLLPDLIPWVSESHGFLYDWTIQGNDLRLTSAIANIGIGHLELGSAGFQGETADVYQRIHNSDGSFTDVLAGTFVYHPEHGHIHFEEFVEFRLRAVTADGGVGDIVAAGSKVSFCLLDVERYGSLGSANRQYVNCSILQGISAGWADVYHRGLPGQSIEITNVPDGAYWLEVVADPANRIVESDETNNVARIKIELVRPPGNDPITPDTFEPNDSLATASILAPPELHTYSNLSIHASLNDDYFRVTASSGGVMAFDLAFRDSLGNIDLEILDASGAVVGRSEASGNREHVIIDAIAGENYFVRAYGSEGATNPLYSMTIDPAYASAPAIDPFTEGADAVQLTSGGRSWHARGGNDRVGGTAVRDVVAGDSGNDLLAGMAGADDLYGGAGADWLKGGKGDDWLDGGSGSDLALYSDASAFVTVDLMASTATGGAGRDTLVGIERVFGSAFGDRLYGDALGNTLLGDRGQDRLEGRAGDDVLIGGIDRDMLVGGKGQDQFVFRSLAEVRQTVADVIADFQHGIDTIDLERIDASNVLAGNNGFVWRGLGDFTQSPAGELRFARYDNPGTAHDCTMIFCDTDGDLGAEFRIRLTGLVNLTANDFAL